MSLLIYSLHVKIMYNKSFFQINFTCISIHLHNQKIKSNIGIPKKFNKISYEKRPSTKSLYWFPEKIMNLNVER